MYKSKKKEVEASWLLCDWKDKDSEVVRLPIPRSSGNSSVHDDLTGLYRQSGFLQCKRESLDWEHFIIDNKI